MSIKTDLTASVRRHLRYIKHSLEKKPPKLSFGKGQLEERAGYYKAELEKFRQELERFQDPGEGCFENTRPFGDYEILSFNGDRMGKVFRKDGKIYRGIYPEAAGDLREMWRSGLLQTLSAHGMIPPTELTGFSAPGYPIILSHGIVTMSQSKLWTPDMIRDAAIFICMVKRIANIAGFTLHDGHLNNVTFHEGRPMFTDIGSFVKDRGQKTVCDREIVFSGCARLAFLALGNNIVSRIQTYDEENNAIWLRPRHYDDVTFEYYKLINLFRRRNRFRSSPAACKCIRRLFCYGDVRPEYIDLVFPRSGPAEETAYSGDIEEIVSEVRALGLPVKTAVDVGGTQGRLAAALYEKAGLTVTALEDSDRAADQAYALFREKSIRGCAYEFHYLYGRDESSEGCIRSDLACAVDLTHSVFSYQQYRADSLLNSLRKLSRGYAALTYYPGKEPGEKYIPLRDQEGRESEERFKACFGEFFEILSCKTSGGPAGGEGYHLTLVGKIRED